MHYNLYIKLVVENHLIKPMIDQAEKALEMNEGSEHLGAYLDKIREIEDGQVYKEESYAEFE